MVSQALRSQDTEKSIHTGFLKQSDINLSAIHVSSQRTVCCSSSEIRTGLKNEILLNQRQQL